MTALTPPPAAQRMALADLSECLSFSPADGRIWPCWPDAEPEPLFMAGTQLHALEGVVKVTPLRYLIDPDGAGRVHRGQPFTAGCGR